MKVLWFLISVIACAQARARHAQSVREQFREVLEREMQFHGRNQSNEERSLGGCPLARYHSNFLGKRDHSGRNPADIVKALNVLRERGVPDVELRGEEMKKEIKKQTSDICQNDDDEICDPSNKYRTADGSCNNLDFPNWGRAGVQQFRLLNPVYDGVGYSYGDGFYTIRNTTFYGLEPLPHPRYISNIVHKSTGPARKSQFSTLNVYQMGQFLDHDITLTPGQTYTSDCCQNADDTFNCIPIFIQEDESSHPFFRQGYCMNVQRSRASGCDPDQREQISDLTSFIDASNVYGSSREEQLELRDSSYGVAQGTMKIPNNRLPPSDDFSCTNNGISSACPQCGDERCATVPALTSYHQVFVMEHNRIANILAEAYSDPDELFEETRRIVIAIMQHIVYDEYLPAFLSEEAMNFYELRSDEPYEYNDHWNPTMSNEFGHAFRCGHTWIPRTMAVFDTDFSFITFRKTEETFNDGYLYTNDFDRNTYGKIPGPDGLALWLMEEFNAETDHIVEAAVRDLLFQNTASQTAFDLVSLNIIRGRDHGIPGYTEYVRWCFDEYIYSWDNLVDWGLMTDDLVDKLQQAYSIAEDIDLFVGLLAESSEGDFGPTVNCLLGDQFYAAKYGDRFFYLNTDSSTNPYPFTQEQIDAIRDYSMSKLFCNNYDFDTIDANAFEKGDRVPCDYLTDLDIEIFFPSAPYYRRNQNGGGQGTDGGDKRQGGVEDNGENSGDDGSGAGTRPSESHGNDSDTDAGKRWFGARGVNRARGSGVVAGKPLRGTGAALGQRGVARAGVPLAGKRGRAFGPHQRGGVHFGGEGAGKRGRVAGSSQPGVARSGGAEGDGTARGDGANHKEIAKEKKDKDALEDAIEDLLRKLKEV